jgi:hypothetical protein
MDRKYLGERECLEQNKMILARRLAGDLRRGINKCSLADILCVQWTSDCLGHSNDIPVEDAGVFNETERRQELFC